MSLGSRKRKSTRKSKSRKSTRKTSKKTNSILHLKNEIQQVIKKKYLGEYVV
jgi:hypothetical protein